MQGPFFCLVQFYILADFSTDAWEDQSYKDEIHFLRLSQLLPALPLLCNKQNSFEKIDS